MDKSEIQIKIGNRIKELRNLKGMSQEKLANLSGLDRTYMNSVENGKRNISIINIYKICVGLGCSLSEFFSEKTPQDNGNEQKTN